MRVIQKKILPKYFKEIIRGNKRFELRADEDDIQVGDTVILNEWDNGQYTGRTYSVEVKYVLRNVPEYGLTMGHCIFSW